MITDRKIPFQFGDPRTGDYILFDCTDRGSDYNNSFKTELVSSTLFDGDVSLNGDERDKLDSVQFVLKFAFEQGSKYTQDFVYRLFSGKPRRLFVYQEGDMQGLQVQDVLWQYAKAEIISEQTSGVDQNDGELYFRYEVRLRLMNPEWYKADNTLSYFIDQSANVYPTYDNGFQYDNGEVYNGYEVASFPLFSTLTDDGSKLNFIKSGQPVSIQDRFVRNELFDMSITGSRKAYSITSNSDEFDDTTGLDLLCSRPTLLYLIEVESLLENEFIQITNTSNDTSIKISWNSSISSGTLIYNSYYNLVYVNGNQVSLTDYSIDFPTGQKLQFEPHKGYLNNQFLTTRTDVDNLVFTKSTASTNNIVISTAPPLL